MNAKVLLGVMIFGAGATVLALAAGGPDTSKLLVAAPPPSLTPAPQVEIAAPRIEQAVQVEAQPPVVAQTLQQQGAEIPSKPAVTKVAAAKPPPAPPPVSEPARLDPPLFTTRELDALLAPIALYPDQLLSQILMASTYPLEVIEAARWAARPENDGLQGERLSAALDQQDWDPSVKAVAAFPHVLKMMDSDIGWMGKLGDAFLDQETEVMDSVQRLRREAREADQLNSDARRRVQVEENQIIIEPANPDVVYVPFYDPRDAYGVWPYADYPPVYIPPPLGYTYAPGVYYNFVSISPYWGWSRWDWPRRRIHIIDVPRYTYHNRGRGPVDPGRWRHDPRHRDGGRGRDRDRDGRGNDRPDNRPPPVVNNPPPQQTPPPYANRDPRRYQQPQEPPRDRAGRSTPPGQLPQVTPPLPATAPVPALAPPVSTPPPQPQNFRARRPQQQQDDAQQRMQLERTQREQARLESQRQESQRLENQRMESERQENLRQESLRRQNEQRQNAAPPPNFRAPPQMR